MEEMLAFVSVLVSATSPIEIGSFPTIPLYSCYSEEVCQEKL